MGSVKVGLGNSLYPYIKLCPRQQTNWCFNEDVICL